MYAIPRNVLVKEVNWLGDLVMSLPALRAVRQAAPDSRLSVLVHAPLASFFDGIDWVDEVLPYLRPRSALARTRELARIIHLLRTRHFDLGIAFPRSFSSALWLALARIPRRVGFRSQGRSLVLTESFRIDTRDPSRHQSESWLELVARTFGQTSSAGPIPELHAHPAHLRRMQHRLQHLLDTASRLVALAPGAAYGPAKQWPETHWRELIHLLVDQGHRVVLVGTSQDRPLCERLLLDVPRHCGIVLAGETSVGELMAVLQLVDGYVGNDSGASHLAAALGKPTVTIFGSTNPRRTAPLGPKSGVLYDPPLCSPCLDRTCRFGHFDCLRRIAPSTVVATLETLSRCSTPSVQTTVRPSPA